MAEKYNTEELIEDVRDKMEDEEYPVARIIRAANWAQNKTMRDHKFRFMQVRDTLSISTNDTDVALPDDYFKVTFLGITRPTGRVDELTDNEIPYQIFAKQYANFEQSLAAMPADWCIFGESIRFATPSNANYELPIDYLRRAAKIESETDDTEFPWDHGELLACLTAGRLMRIEGDFDEGDKEFEMADELMVNFVTAEGMGQGTSKPKRINQRRIGGNPTNALGRFR